MSKAFRYACEYHAARLGLAIIMRVGPETACRLAAGLASLSALVLRKRSRIAVDNLLRSGVATTPRQARRIARASFRHMGTIIAESFYASRLTVTFEMPDATRNLLESPGKGIILVSGHLGNWELGAQIISRYKPLTGVARAMNNPRVQALLDRCRMRGDFETVDKHMVNPMGLVRALRRDRILALLTDQHAGSSGLVIDFFGRPASTYATPAVLHRLTHAPIIFGGPIRLGMLRYRVILSEPLAYAPTADRDADTLHITQDLATRLEAMIRQYPEQYLWAHRRWKV